MDTFWDFITAQAADPHWLIPVVVMVAAYTWMVSLGDVNISEGFAVMVTVDSLVWFWYLRDDHPTAAWWALGGPWGLLVTIFVCWAGVDYVWERWRRREMARGRGTASDVSRMVWGGGWAGGGWGSGQRVARHGVSSALGNGTLSSVTVCYWYLAGLSVESLWMAVAAGCSDAAIRAHALGDEELDWEQVADAYGGTTLWTVNVRCDSYEGRCAGCLYRNA